MYESPVSSDPDISSRSRESDVQKLNNNKEYLAIFDSEYKKMALRVDAYEKTQMELEENAA